MEADVVLKPLMQFSKEIVMMTMMMMMTMMTMMTVMMMMIRHSKSLQVMLRNIILKMFQFFV